MTWNRWMWAIIKSLSWVLRSHPLYSFPLSVGQYATPVLIMRHWSVLIYEPWENCTPWALARNIFRGPEGYYICTLLLRVVVYVTENETDTCMLCIVLWYDEGQLHYISLSDTMSLINLSFPSNEILKRVLLHITKMNFVVRSGFKICSYYTIPLELVLLADSESKVIKQTRN